MNLQRAASEFWTWFAFNANRISDLARSEQTGRLDMLLTARVKAVVPGAVWEIGPGEGAEFRFVMSPDGSAERLRRTIAAVDLAPAISGWEFAPAKPPKQWDFRFSITNRVGQHVSLDAGRWKYMMIGYDGNRFFDVTLVAENLPALDQAARILAASVVVEGMLGERQAIELVGALDLVDRVGDRDRERLSDIRWLPKHLQRLTHGKDEAG